MNDKFSDILDRPITDIERPKQLPRGHYQTILEGIPRYDLSTKKQTPYYEFTHRFISPMEDVSREDLNAVLTQKDGSTRPLNEYTMRNAYYITENSAYRLKDFLSHCGFDVKDPTFSMRQAVEETPGCEVIVFVEQTPNEEGVLFSNIRQTVAELKKKK